LQGYFSLQNVRLDALSAGNGLASLSSLPLHQLMAVNVDLDGLEEQRMSMQQERDRLTTMITARRREISTVISSSGATVAAVKDAVAKTAVHNWQGKLNKEHILVFVGAETMFEGSTGWTGTQNTPANHLAQMFTARLEYSAAMAGPATFVIGFDGRNDQQRKKLHDTLCAEGAGSYAELWISYSGQTRRAPSREVFAAQQNREVGYVKLPNSKVRITSKKREDRSLLCFICSSIASHIVSWVAPAPLLHMSPIHFKYGRCLCVPVYGECLLRDKLTLYKCLMFGNSRPHVNCAHCGQNIWSHG
jgi:hypothetical protein